MAELAKIVVFPEVKRIRRRVKKLVGKPSKAVRDWLNLIAAIFIADILAYLFVYFIGGKY